MDQNILQQLRRWDNTSVYPIILLGGPSGIGKTTHARILSRDLGIPYTSHDLHGNARDFIQHLSEILQEHHCAIVDRVFLDGNMTWIENLKSIFPKEMEVALFSIFPVIHEELLEIAVQNMQTRAIALEASGYADEPKRMKCGKTLEDHRKIHQRQIDPLSERQRKRVPRVAYIEILEKGVQRSIEDIALAYREALAGLLHQGKKRKRA
jgi:adenylate kinase family enzyme